MGRIHNFEEFNRINEERELTNEELDLQDDSIMEKLDGEELLSAKQKKLPEGLKKGIIKNLKKKGPKKDEDEEECDDKDKKGKKCEDDDDDEKEEKDDKKGGSDEEKYLTPKQRKLPEGLKKSIIARAKKNK